MKDKRTKVENTGLSPVKGKGGGVKTPGGRNVTLPPTPVAQESENKPFYIVMCPEDLALRPETMQQAMEIAREAAGRTRRSMLIFKLVGGYEITGDPKPIQLKGE